LLSGAEIKNYDEAFLAGNSRIFET
jgi:hypothetical protein